MTLPIITAFLLWACIVTSTPLNITPRQTSYPQCNALCVQFNPQSCGGSPWGCECTAGVLSAQVACYDCEVAYGSNVTEAQGQINSLLNSCQAQGYPLGPYTVTSTIMTPSSTQLPPSSYAPPSTSSPDSGVPVKKTPIGAIVGGSVGGALILGAVVCTIWFMCHRRNRPSKHFESDAATETKGLASDSPDEDTPIPSTSTPLPSVPQATTRPSTYSIIYPDSTIVVTDANPTSATARPPKLEPLPENDFDFATHRQTMPPQNLLDDDPRVR